MPSKALEWEGYSFLVEERGELREKLLGLSSHLGFKEAMASGHGPTPLSDTVSTCGKGGKTKGVHSVGPGGWPEEFRKVPLTGTFLLQLKLRGPLSVLLTYPSSGIPKASRGSPSVPCLSWARSPSYSQARFHHHAEGRRKLLRRTPEAAVPGRLLAKQCHDCQHAPCLLPVLAWYRSYGGPAHGAGHLKIPVLLN